MLLSVYFIIILSSICVRANAELFTATVDLQKLIHTHEIITNELQDYIDNEEKRLSYLKRFLKVFKREHRKALEDIPNYLSNPINAFTLIKRLTFDLAEIRNVIKTTDPINDIIANHKDLIYPTYEDLQGAAEALDRLQKTYKLNIEELADGKINGVSYSSPITAIDCYKLGELLYEQKHFISGCEWTIQALKKYYQEKNDYQFTDKDIIQSIVFAYYKLGDLKDGYDVQKLKYFQNKMAEVEALLELHGKQNKTTPKNKKISIKEKRLNTSSIFKKTIKMDALCRGEYDIPLVKSSRLTCHYLTKNDAFLKLAPIKMEMLYINPDIVLFHDVMYDDEINVLIKMATPRLKRSLVHHRTTNEPVPAPYRISKYEWLLDNESDVISRVSRRVGHMTGLNMDTAEALQISNYGIGGFYGPHYDFRLKSEDYKVPFRHIATVMFYMSEVTLGGATAFPFLGFRVLPKKGAAIFWYNLHASGEGDLATYHAACPVLQGSKWVANKWIKSVGQEFHRPCNLEYQEEGILHP